MATPKESLLADLQTLCRHLAPHCRSEPWQASLERDRYADLAHDIATLAGIGVTVEQQRSCIVVMVRPERFSDLVELVAEVAPYRPRVSVPRAAPSRKKAKS